MLKIIKKLINLKILLAGFLIMIFSSLYSVYSFNKVNYFYAFLSLVAMVLLQSATNLLSDYIDYKKGKEEVLVYGKLKPKQIIAIILIYEVVSFTIGLYIAYKTSYYIMIIAILGAIISVSYVFGPAPISYTPLGELIFGATMGIGIITTEIYIQTGIINYESIMVAIPSSICAATILLSNNISDLQEDKRCGRKTLPILIGQKASERLWIFNVVILLIFTAIYTVLQIYPIEVCVVVALLFPYTALKILMNKDKNIQDDGRTLANIIKVGIRYHSAVVVGILIYIYS